MTREVSELLKKALVLPPEARAALAGSLLESFDDVVDESAEEKWNKEIARRITELDSGKVKPIPWARRAGRSQPSYKAQDIHLSTGSTGPFRIKIVP